MDKPIDSSSDSDSDRGSKKSAKIPMINWYKTIKNDPKPNPYRDEHGLEVLMRAIICTASGGGKTNMLINILYAMSDTYHKFIVVTKEREPLYDMLQERLGDKIEIFLQGEFTGLPVLQSYQAGLVIFDDMVLSQTKNIGEVFIRCRKQHYGAIFISQSYYGIHKIIRQNCNYVWLGRGILDRDLRMILSDYSINISRDTIKQIYHRITSEKMHFMLLDMQDRTIRRDISEVVMDMN